MGIEPWLINQQSGTLPLGQYLPQFPKIMKWIFRSFYPKREFKIVSIGYRTIGIFKKSYSIYEIGNKEIFIGVSIQF